jgi:RNA polymerase sigma-70 factor (ECF subfamily)
VAEASTTQLQGLIERMNAGEASARAELLAHAGERLRRLARKMLQDFPRVRRWEETDDVVQNALLRLLQALQAVPVATVAEFFRLAARHIRWELIDLARHYAGPEGLGANHATDVPGLSPLPERPDSTNDVGRLALWSEFHRHVEQLPEEERAVFDLLWYQELPQAEAATLLNVSVPTVKRRWLAARLRLQAALKGEPLL